MAIGVEWRMGEPKYLFLIHNSLYYMVIERCVLTPTQMGAFYT